MSARRELAQGLGMTSRTLRNWRREAEGPLGDARRPGRPRRSPGERAEAKELVCVVLVRLGTHVGERTVQHELGGALSLRLIRECLVELKSEQRARTRRAREHVRFHVRVLARGTIWSVDATHLGRDDEGRSLLGEIVRDVASTRTLGVSIGPAPTSAEVVVLLQRVVDATGQAPLVISIDNGPENQGQLNAWCQELGVVRLRNLPHTPQHNAWVEHGNAELKAETELGKGVRIRDLHAVAHDVVRALDKIDGARPRPTRGWKTARVAYAQLPSAEALLDRNRFVAAVRCAIDVAVQDCRTGRERRLAERKAILTTLENHGLITRTRGRAPKRAPKAESVS